MEKTRFQERSVVVNGVSVHLVEAGDTTKPSILFLHGYPENWREFEEVFSRLEKDYYLLAIDLPGIGKSDGIDKQDKLTIARFIRDLIRVLQLDAPVLVGHDVGGMITYSFVKNIPDVISKAVIICTAVPGVEPWETVKSNPYIWHFAFYAIPELPEQLIKGKHALLFDYFYNAIAFNKTAITTEHKESYVESYESERALTTSLGWYRAFPQDEKANASTHPVEVPVLYLKGEKDFGAIETYLAGFQKSGLKNIRGESVPGSAHFAPEENSAYIARAIDRFITSP